MRLRNIVSREVLKQRMEESTEKRSTLSFYKYWNIEDPAAFRNELFIRLSDIGVLGRIYVANEGINGQISVPESNVESLRDIIYSYPEMHGIRLNFAVEDDGKSFYLLKIKVRDKIVADGLNDETFDIANKGKHVKASEFNEIIEKEDTILIDMRNHYEHEVGHFKHAITPDVDTFRDSLPIIDNILEEHKNKNIVMYCTGGIRCEKASAWFRHIGHENVYQLEGGIIKYRQEIEEQGLPNKFIGKNFVFDERRGERISDDIIANCHQCGAPCDDHTNCAFNACNLLFIQCESCKKKYENHCSIDCQTTSKLPETWKASIRRIIGLSPKEKVFKKGRKLK